jgi:hypothetical protein
VIRFRFRVHCWAAGKWNAVKIMASVCEEVGQAKRKGREGGIVGESCRWSGGRGRVGGAAEFERDCEMTS